MTERTWVVCDEDGSVRVDQHGRKVPVLRDAKPVRVRATFAKAASSRQRRVERSAREQRLAKIEGRVEWLRKLAGSITPSDRRWPAVMEELEQLGRDLRAFTGELVTKSEGGKLPATWPPAVPAGITTETPPTRVTLAEVSRRGGRQGEAGEFVLGDSPDGPISRWPDAAKRP